MSIPHLVVYLTRPLFAAGINATSITTAQIILNAALYSHKSPSSILTLSNDAPPAPLLAASVGAGIEWSVWFAALTQDSNEAMTVVYGPGYVKTQLGAGALTDVWSEEAQGSVIRISRVRQPSSRATVQPSRILIPTLLSTQDDECSSSSSSSDDSDAESDVSSSATVYSLSPASPKTKPFVLSPLRSRPLPAIPKSTPLAKKDTTAYMYKGGVTRVMTGGVMLGPRAPAKPKTMRKSGRV
ncbi:hypothetical protein C8F01DRAFT_103770 [Mycena amicta]|nr:hypothetical protein C8F01DRAFT_103770 [Mycena amicta]